MTSDCECQKSLTVKVRGEEKGCKSQSTLLSLCQKLALSRGGPSGKSAGGRPPECAGLQHISRGLVHHISGGWVKYRLTVDISNCCNNNSTAINVHQMTDHKTRSNTLN